MPALQSDFAAGTQAARSCAQLVFNPLFADLVDSDSMVLEVLHRFLVFLRCGARLKRAEVSPLSGLRILLPRVQAITTRFKFSDHDLFSGARRLCHRVFLF
jgi:hypothetical protein